VPTPVENGREPACWDVRDAIRVSGLQPSSVSAGVAVDSVGDADLTEIVLVVGKRGSDRGRAGCSVEIVEDECSSCLSSLLLRFGGIVESSLT
jgi:hypothetical protein